MGRSLSITRLLLHPLGFRIEYRTFNALIAAFGKHQQVKMAFQLADEMTEVGFIPNEDTYASLLIACNSEKSVGFKYAIEVRESNEDASVLTVRPCRSGVGCWPLVFSQRRTILGC